MTSAGKLAVVVNASISLELPYNKRNIAVTFGSMNQSYALNLSTEFAVFYFDQIQRVTKAYPLIVAFTVVDETSAPFFSDYTTTDIRSETVTVTASSSDGTGNKLTLATIFYPIVLTMIFFV